MCLAALLFAGTAKSSGKTITMPISEHFEIRDEKILSIGAFYFDA